MKKSILALTILLGSVAYAQDTSTDTTTHMMRLGSIHHQASPPSKASSSTPHRAQPSRMPSTG